MWIHHSSSKEEKFSGNSSEPAHQTFKTVMILTSLYAYTPVMVFVCFVFLTITASYSTEIKGGTNSVGHFVQTYCLMKWLRVPVSIN